MCVTCCAAEGAEQQTVAVMYEHRAAPPTLQRSEIIDTVIEPVPRPPHKVQLKGASRTICTQVR